MNTSTTLDLNCDMGEGFGAYKMGNDIEILDHVTSANIACGFHAGDPPTMRRIVAAALAKGVAIGAHPGLPDLQGFGRRAMQISPAEAYAMVVYQVGALAGFAQAAGGKLNHVKPHGALYNMAVKDRALADAIAQAVFDIDPKLVFFGLAGSEMINAANALGLRSACEVFADRSYQDDGSLSLRGTARRHDRRRRAVAGAGPPNADGLGACAQWPRTWQCGPTRCVCTAINPAHWSSPAISAAR